MAKKRNSSRKRQNASQQQSGRKSQTTMGTIVVAIIGLIFWWFTGNSPDGLINNSDAGNIGATPIVQEVAQASDEADAPVESAAESDDDTASDEITDGNAGSSDVSTDEATENSADDETVSDTEAVAEEAEAVDPEPATADTPVPVPAVTDTPVPAPTATTPPKPTNTAVPRPRGPPGMSEIHIDDLPPEARDTIDLIFSGGPFPFDRDGITFQNREGILPDHNRGYYEEYTVITPGLSHRGAKRIVIGREDEMYYTDDHYESFSWIAED